MPLFKFSAKDADGKKVAGEVEAVDQQTLIEILQKQGLIPTEVKMRDGGGSGFGKFKISIPKLGGGIPGSEIVGFTRQFSTMVSAGLPITDALVILQKQTKNHIFSRAIGQIVADVEGGSSLSQALSKHPKIFSVIYIKLVEAGETGGVLDKVLAKLADTLEKDREFKSKTKGAFIYPVIVIVVMFLVMGVMMIFVIPRLTSLYTEIGAALPLPTRILIGMSNFLRGFWWLVLIIIALLVWGFKVFSATIRGGQIMSNIMLRVPIWGKIRKALILAEFTRTLGLLIGTGIPIIAALKVVAGLLDNPVYKEGIDFAITRVERGSPLYQPLAANSAFPPIISQMLRVGEETGKMDEVLIRLSAYFESESENLIRNLTTALEPVILVVLGLGVAILVLSIILPIYNLTAQF
ncbi:MAG: type II secretion system F family protein [Candidatus Curtissbacteria bacterium]